MNHSSKAIEIEDVEFQVAELERAAEAAEEFRNTLLGRNRFRLVACVYEPAFAVVGFT
jgi:hypothetical protein